MAFGFLTWHSWRSASFSVKPASPSPSLDEVWPRTDLNGVLDRMISISVFKLSISLLIRLFSSSDCAPKSRDFWSVSISFFKSMCSTRNASFSLFKRCVSKARHVLWRSSDSLLWRKSFGTFNSLFVLSPLLMLKLLECQVFIFH